eukprot:symbB.v1.2.041784.t1/scaffold8639.1/size5532/1
MVERQGCLSKDGEEDDSCILDEKGPTGVVTSARQLLVYVSLATVGANVVPGCDLGLLLTLQRQVEPVVSEIAEIHYNFTSAKHFEVIEVISMFQVDRICRSVLKVVESGARCQRLS